jgi:hypothetical protein
MTRKFVSIGLSVGLAALALPSLSTARGGSDCNYAAGQTFTSVALVDEGPTGNQIYLYAGNGMAEDPSVWAVGACVNRTEPPSPNRLDGGTAEVGVTAKKGTPIADGLAPGAYAVADGDNDNTFPVIGLAANDEQGYAGVSNVESGDKASCDGSWGAGTGSNSGGCVGLPAPGQEFPIPLIVCGNTSGNQWESNARDGCNQNDLLHD